MDKQKTLDDIFAAARTDEPVMRREESREVIRSGKPQEKSSWLLWRALFGIAALVTATGLWLAWPGQQKRTTVSNITSGKAAMLNAPTSSSGTAPNNGSSPLRPIGPLRTVAPGKQTPAPPAPHNGNLSGVQMIVLQPSILDSLGVRSTSDNAVLYHTMYSSGDSAMVLRIRNSTIDPVTLLRIMAPRHITQPQWEFLEPRMITDQQGKQIAKNIFPRDNSINSEKDVLLLKQWQDSAHAKPQSIQPDTSPDPEDLAAEIRDAIQRFHQRLFNTDRLIPVRINTSDTSYYIFWYEPTAELLSLLPSPILARLRLETIASKMALYDTDQDTAPRMNDLRQLHATLDSLISLRIDNGETVPVPDDARPGTTIMETGRVTDGAISLYSISPNPNSGEFRVHFAVRERRVIEFSVYDINGGRLQAATSGVRMKDEDDEVSIRLKKELPAGIYLLVLSTDKGERAVQRLVIERKEERAIGEVKKHLLTASAQTSHREKTMEVIGVEMIEASPRLLDSLDIRVTDSGRVYYEASPIDPDRVLAFQLPDGDRPVTVPMAVAPHIMPWPARIKKWSRMITDDRGKQVSRQMWSANIPVHDFSDALHSLQDTAALSSEEVATVLRRVDSLRSARGIVDYERLFDLNRLVPVRVDVPNHGMLQTEWYQSSYYTFWYDPTPEFLAVMPDSTLVQIRSELAAATLALPDTGYVRRWNEQFVSTLRTTVDSLLDLRRRDGHVLPSEIRPIPGTGFFTIGQTSAGALAITSVAPDPSNGSARLRYLLSEPREVEVALHDIHGTRLRVLSERVKQTAGEHEQGIEFGGVPAGMYLLVVSTDRGERGVQRVVIER